jgi:F-type H+-transporting ATPase subunit b
MKKIIVTLGLVAVGLFANEHAAVEHVSMSDTDFIPRLINFVIFVGILWYLLADKVKEFYSNRSKAIADSFSEVETKLKESEAQKRELKAKVEEAHKKAEEIVKDAQKETEILKSRIIESAKNEIAMLNKQFEDYKSYEESKMKKEVVAEYLNELVKDIHLSSEEVANIVTKKVG